METIQDINHASGTIEEKCLEMGQILGLSEPVSPEVLQAATEDETYAHNLLVCRKEPAFLKHLLANPPQTLIQSFEPEEQSNLELLNKATSTLLRWAKTGFSVVDDETLARREEACLACPNLSAPQKLVQKLIPSKDATQKLGQRTGNKVCQLCGCNLGKKIRIPSESCPDRHPTAAGMTRWGEPRE
ncbi:hypothetical protein [Moorena sp. SIO4G3]|uniref:hypothetical protein n=1 Tax=Moorena sp. SIO4G3 TaxID=2607821 RepID=UPI001428ECE8|nr:hypothetical protein [Moorena sp. SIO4G3]NEO81561.1 hypothetical protein [Moorena sp. SIO4G3]